MFNQTTLEDIKEVLEKILEQLEFMNLPPESKQEEWDCIKQDREDEWDKIREEYKVKAQELKDKTQGRTPKPD